MSSCVAQSGHRRLPYEAGFGQPTLLWIVSQYPTIDVIDFGSAALHGGVALNGRMDLSSLSMLSCATHAICKPWNPVPCNRIPHPRICLFVEAWLQRPAALRHLTIRRAHGLPIPGFGIPMGAHRGPQWFNLVKIHRIYVNPRAHCWFYSQF